MMFSLAKGRPVVDTGTAETVGKVKGFLIDPSTRSIVALELRKTDKGRLLRWSDITAFGTEAVTIADAGTITDTDAALDALRGKAHALVKKRVLSTRGDTLGIIGDVDFDPDSGRLNSLLLNDAEDIAAQRLVGIGSYAVVVEAAQSDA